ncbi:S-layer homology domain-containing protein [Paenibacillus sp. UNC496MF]|uniref:S-layer homology domain-containing protein n=1 Tax=Paenibacillus sp. UNC496MF TaxID=1502753 RepID=UPI001C42F404|nr:S-layer homology domain-containing protein [Paenibacillus sp. UNC496MF]
MAIAGPGIWRGTSAYADAAPSALQPSATLVSDVTDWIYDANTDLIYAISSESNTLLFINAEDLSIEKELQVGSAPKDIEQNGDRLYVALSGATFIQAVDIPSRSLGELLPTTGQPIALTVTSDAIFYASEGIGSANLFRLELASGASVKINARYISDPVLKADESNHLLFIGETGSTGSDFFAYDYLTGQIGSDSTYDGNYGFGFPYGKIMVDGTDAFFGGSRMNEHNLAEIRGAYPRLGDYSYLDGALLDLSGSYVATDQGLFDKDRYVQIAPFPYEVKNALIGRNGRVFLQKDEYNNKTIEAYDLDVTAPLPTLGFAPGMGDSVVSSYKIDSWTTEEGSPYIYLVSSDTNELAVLRKDDLSLVSKRFVGSRPVHVALRAGKLYIALRGETYIGVLDANDIDSSLQRILIPSNPDRVMPSGKNIFYWGQDTFYNLHAVDGSTDRRVVNADGQGFGAADYDASTNTLFAGSNGVIYKFNADTLAQISKETASDFWTTGNVRIDGDSLYYGLKRMNKNAVTSILGTYPSQVLRAYGKLVFGETAIYDRDSYSKAADLPFAVTDAYVSADQAIYVSTANQLYKFADMDAIRGVFEGRTTPKNVVLVDTGLMPDQLSGYLVFEPAEDQNRVNNYAFEFLDAAGKKLGPVNATWDKRLEDGRWMFDVPQTAVPSGAQYVNVTATSTEGSLGSAKTLIWDVPAYFADRYAFSDQNADAGFIQGRASWTAGNEYADVAYNLFFLGEDGIIGEPLARVEGGKTSYAYDIPKTEIPEGAFGLALVQEREQSLASVYQYYVFAEFITPDVASGDIVVVKNRYTDDAVTVGRVEPGDVVKVYSNRGLIGSATVGAGKTTVTLTIENVGNSGEQLLITRTMPGRMESDGTLVTIPSVDGGIGGGGGGPIGPIGPGAPGQTVPPSNGDDASEPGGDLKATVEKDGGGKSYAKVEVPSDYVQAALSGENFRKTGTVTLSSASDEAKIVFRVLVSDIRSIAKEAGGGMIEVSVPEGSMTVSAQSLLDAIGGGSEGRTVEMTLEQADDALTGSLKQRLAKGSQLLGKPMNFELAVTSGGVVWKIESFSRYVNHTILIDTANVPLNELAGLMYDSASGVFVPVPVKFSYRDGKLTASLYRKGNSVYAVVRNNANFKDMPAVPAYAEGIQALANRTVVNGFPDGTFKPGNSVTRAEFAAMLVKALGIAAPAVSGTPAFKDVPANAWYAASVKAAVGAGIIAGYEDGSYRPSQTISHQEAIAMLVKALRYAGYAASASGSQSPGSAGVPAWAKPYYDEAMQAGLIGRANDPFQFKTNAAATRKDCALLLYRVVNDLLFQ